MKNDASIRICGDYKITLNKISKQDNYPIPKIEDLYSNAGGFQFLHWSLLMLIFKCRAYLGMLNYYGKFLRNIADLHELLKKSKR